MMAPYEITVTHTRVGIFNYRNVLRIDWIMVAIVLALAVIGLLTLYSATYDVHGQDKLWKKQLVFFAIGTAAALFILCIDHRFVVSWAPCMYVLTIATLVAVLYFGKTIKGGQSWIRLGPFNLQPSELAKLVVIYTLTCYFTRIGYRVRRLPFFILAFAIGGIPALLIVKQSDLGTAITLGPVVVVMLYIAGCKRWHLVLITVLGLLAVPIAYSGLSDYQKLRIRVFIDPDDVDPKIRKEKMWQTEQSMITVGSGGMSGRGFKQGTQTRLDYMAENHTDFIFSTYAEEQGFLGAMAVLTLFAAFFLRGLQYAKVAHEKSGSLLAVGVVTVLSFHVFVNIAITLGLMPVTGIPLPFMSYGGSFYLTTMMGVGILLNVNVRRGFFED